MRAASVKRQVSEEELNTSIADYEHDDRLTERERAVLRFVDRLDGSPEDVGRSDFDALGEHLSDEEVVELILYLVLNLGMHIVFSTLDFYPMFDPDGNIVSQDDSRRIYGAAPSELATDGTA